MIELHTPESVRSIGRGGGEQGSDGGWLLLEDHGHYLVQRLLLGHRSISIWPSVLPLRDR